MADEKEKGAEEQEEQPKKKGLMPVLLVLIGAALGGAGVVVMSPKKEPEPHGPPPVVIKVFDHPDEMAFTFNPVVERGHKTALLHFLFSYKADVVDVFGEQGEAHGDGGGGGGHGGGHGAAAEPAHLHPVPEAIQLNWNRAYSRCLEVLTDQRAETLLHPDGKRMIKRRLIDELSATLFPDGIATVDDILWTKFVVQ